MREAFRPTASWPVPRQSPTGSSNDGATSGCRPPSCPNWSSRRPAGWRDSHRNRPATFHGYASTAHGSSPNGPQREGPLAGPVRGARPHLGRVVPPHEGRSGGARAGPDRDATHPDGSGDDTHGGAPNGSAATTLGTSVGKPVG